MKSESQNQILMYEVDGGQLRIDVQFENETVWLSQAQLVELFGSSKANISEHIKNIYAEGELALDSTVRNFRTVQKEGKLDEKVVCRNSRLTTSVGYRLKFTQRKKLLSDAGKISYKKATEKAALECRDKAKSLSVVEKAYLESIKAVEKKVSKKVKSNK